MVTSEDKIAAIITRFPHIKKKLIERNKLFQNLDNPVVFNTVGKFARIADVAKISGEDLDELLGFINGLIVAADQDLKVVVVGKGLVSSLHNIEKG